MKMPAVVGALLLAAGAAGAQVPPPITRFTAAGIPVILKPIAANDVIALRLYLRGGSAALTPATAGIERLIGQVAPTGTAKYTKDRFEAIKTETGTTIGGAAEYDFTVATLQAVRQHWTEAWDLFVQAVRYPTFPAAEIEQAQGQIVDGLRQRPDVPDTHLQALADSVVYAGHPYARDPQGTVEAVSRLTRDDLVAWHRRRLTKANLVLVVVGNVAREDLAAKVEAAFGTLPATGGEAPAVPALGALSRELVTVARDLPTNYVLGLFAAPNLASPDYPGFRVATRVLSERLFEEVRTKRNLSYAVSAGVGTRVANRGTLYVTAVRPDTTLTVMLAEVRRMQRELTPAARLGEATNVFVTQYLMSQQTNMGQATELGMFELAGGGWENAGRFLERMRAVTPAEVRRAAQTYMKNARFVVIGDPASVDRGLFTSL